MEEPIFSFIMRFGSVLFGSARIRYRIFGIRYIRYLPASVVHCQIPIPTSIWTREHFRLSHRSKRTPWFIAVLSLKKKKHVVVGRILLLFWSLDPSSSLAASKKTAAATTSSNYSLTFPWAKKLGTSTKKTLKMTEYHHNTRPYQNNTHNRFSHLMEPFLKKISSRTQDCKPIWTSGIMLNPFLV